MFTLHDTIELTKKALLFIAIGSVVILLLYGLFKLGVFIKDTFYPTPPPAAEIGFGKLPQIQFGTTKEGSFTYTVDTLTGTLPTNPDRVNVYELIKKTPEFYDTNRMKAKARKIGFNEQPEKIADDLYVFKNNDPLQSMFTINALTDSFTLKTSYLTYAPLQNSTQVTDTVKAVEGATKFFQSLNSLPSTINTASTSAKGFSLRDGVLQPATSIATTQIVRVDFTYKTVDSLPILFPNYPESFVYAIVVGSEREPTILEASYLNNEISDRSSDYPIKTTEEAYTDLTEGRGYIASYYGKTFDVAIKEVNLAYIMTSEDQQYLMPIFVFTGDDGFTGFVSAVKQELMAE